MVLLQDLDVEEVNRNVYHDKGSLGDGDKVPEFTTVDVGQTPPGFEKELAKYQSSKEHAKRLKKTYDWKTSNKSFLELYSDLYRLGIKHNKFFLVIYDTDLIGVDPYAPNLPLEMQVKIMMEVIRNPWYFLREICRIPSDGKPICIGGGEQFRIDRNSLASWYLFLMGIDHYASKPRQTGKTQNSLAEFNYAFHFGSMASTITFSNKDAKNNTMNLYRMKCQRDMMPAYLQMKIGVDSDGNFVKEGNNVTTMRNPVTGNNITLLPRAQSAESANSNGRGMTASLCYFDEFDFMPYNTIVLQSAAFAYSTAAENAAKNNAMHCRVFSSTPGDLDTRDGGSASEYIDKMLVWDDTMLDLPPDQLRAAVYDTKRNGIVYVEHNWKQLKKTQVWYEKQCQLVSYKQETIMREIDLMRLHGSSMSPFDREDVLYIQAHRKEPIEKVDFSKNLCPFFFYKKTKINIPYIVAVDPSEGLGSDNTAIEVINPYTLETDVEFKSPYISQPDCADMIVKFMQEYCPRAMIVVESNKGRELINCLRRSRFMTQVWYDTKKMLDITEKVSKHGIQAQEAMHRRAFGLDTLKNNRPVMYGILENFMKEEKYRIVSKFLVEDIVSLIRKPNGRIEASSGKHDDNVMAYLIGLFVYFHADNLEEFGLSRGMMDPEDNPLHLDPEKASLENLVNLMPSLPPDLQSLIRDNMPVDEKKESENYAKMIQRAKADNPYDKLMSREDLDGDFDNYQNPGNDILMGEDLDRYDQQIVSLNDYDSFASSSFDINDYI